MREASQNAQSPFGLDVYHIACHFSGYGNKLGVACTPHVCKRYQNWLTLHRPSTVQEHTTKRVGHTKPWAPDAPTETRMSRVATPLALECSVVPKGILNSSCRSSGHSGRTFLFFSVRHQARCCAGCGLRRSVGFHGANKHQAARDLLQLLHQLHH